MSELVQLVDRRGCLRLVTVAQSRRWKQCSFLTERQTCFFFPSSEPSHCWIAAASPSTQPTAVSFVTLFTHIIVEVYYGRAGYCSLPFLAVNCLSCLCAQAQLKEKKKKKDPSVIISTFWVWQWDSRWQASHDRLVVKSSATIFSPSDTSVCCENKDSYQNIYLFLSEYSQHNFKVRLVHCCWTVSKQSDDLKFVLQSCNQT